MVNFKICKFIKILNNKEFYFKAESDKAQRIELAIKWNRLNDAKKEFQNSNTLGTNEINDLFEVALLENKREFVDLLLQNGVEIFPFLTKERLKKLYNNETVLVLIKN